MQSYQKISLFVKGLADVGYMISILGRLISAHVSKVNPNFCMMIANSPMLKSDSPFILLSNILLTYPLLLAIARF